MKRITQLLLLIIATGTPATAQQCWQGSVSGSQISLVPVVCAGPTPTPSSSPTPSATPSPTPTPASGNLLAAYTATNWNGKLRDISGNDNDASPFDAGRAPVYSATAANGKPGLISNSSTALILTRPIMAQTAVFIFRHLSGQQIQSSLLSDYRGNTNTWNGASYLHVSNLLDHQEAPFLSSNAAALINGTIEVNGVSYPPLLAPKPTELSIVTFKANAPLPVDMLLNNRLYPGAGCECVVAEARFYAGSADAEVAAYTAAKISEYSIHAAPLVIAVGDSKTHGASDWWNCTDCTYPPQLAAALAAQGVRVDYGNYAIGGESMQQMLDRFDTTIAPLLADRSRPRIVVLQGGGNVSPDGSGGIGPAPASPEAKAHEIYDISVAYARKVHALGGKIIITTMTPSNPTYGASIGFNYTAFENSRQILNSLWRASAEFDDVDDRGADPLAGCAACADDKSPESGYQNARFLDGVHENRDECRRWGQNLAPVIVRVLSK